MKPNFMKSITKGLALFILLFSSDRLAKFLILKSSGSKVFTSFFSFDITINRGIAWGFLHSDNAKIFLVVTGLILAIIVTMFWYTWQRLKIGKSVNEEILILAGASSNLLDRVLYSGVIDFIHFHIGEWSFPIFNLADMFIVIGVLCILVSRYEP